MKTIKTLLHLLEWTALYFLLPPHARGLLARRFSRRRAEQVTAQGTAFPELARGLMLVIIGCVAFVTSCTLWFVSQGWGEALYGIPLFVASLFIALLYRGLKARIKKYL